MKIPIDSIFLCIFAKAKVALDNLGSSFQFEMKFSFWDHVFILKLYFH